MVPAHDLFDAIMDNEIDHVRQLLANGVDPNEPADTEEGIIHPLINAANSDHHEIIRILIEAGADCNTQLGIYQNTAYHVACFKGAVASVIALVEGGCDVNAVDVNGETGQDKAYQQRRKDVFDALAELGLLSDKTEDPTKPQKRPPDVDVTQGIEWEPSPVACDACLTTVEMFMSAWIKTTERISKEGSARMSQGKDGGAHLRSTDIVKTETDGRICAQKQLRGFPMPEYIAKYCNAMIGGAGPGKFRSRLQNSLLNKHWVDLPALKRDVCERLNANLCAEGEGLAPVPYAADDVEPRCTYCQEMVSDAHFMVRRLRVEEWQRVAAFEYAMEEVCRAAEMRHQGGKPGRDGDTIPSDRTNKRENDAKRNVCEEVRDALEDEHVELAHRHFVHFGEGNAESWKAGNATVMPTLQESVDAICVEAVGLCGEGGKPRPKEKKSKKKKKKKSKKKKG